MLLQLVSACDLCSAGRLIESRLLFAELSASPAQLHVCFGACPGFCLPLHRSGVLKMRKLIPCYLAGFASPRRLQGQLFAAQSIPDWQHACADPDRWGFDPLEPFPAAALRRPRLKGGPGQAAGAAKHKVVLPPGWLDEGDGDDDYVLPEECLGVDACEG